MELKEIRRKIESVSNIRKLTSALETLSALKMKRSQKIALESRPFAKKVSQLLTRFDPILRSQKAVYLQNRPVKNIMVATVSSDRGFCGSFNQNVLRLAEKEIKKLEGEAEVTVFPIGKKALSFFKKKGKETKYNFFGIGDYGELEEIKPISDFMVKAFIEDQYQKIYLVWTDFISTFVQKPRIIKLLPLEKESLQDFLEIAQPQENQENLDYIVEPSLAMVATQIVPQLVEYLIYQCILESNASEHSARMMAMRNASDNARNRVTELTLDYNKARQEQITREVCEISSTKEVLE